MNYKVNGIKQILASGRPVIGTWAQMGSPEMVEIVGHAGYDFVIIDAEHGSFYLETAVQMVRAAEAVGITPIIRIPDKNPSFITRMLDAGIMGIVVPQVNSSAEVESAVSAARYHPLGNRGACPRIRVAGHQAEDWPEFIRWSNENVLVWPLIEGLDGVNNYSQIIDVPGIDAIMLGPTDLSQAMGLPGQQQHPAVVAKLEEMYKMAAAKNIETIAVASAPTPEGIQKLTQRWLDFGCRIIVAGSDRKVAVDGFKAIVNSVRELF
ncbi:MAG: aldolase/citrate lyase family protein [Negativicutes bacterium]|nr:aldolase/citrate lyase family protein [Negativicutes bacterium]